MQPILECRESRIDETVRSDSRRGERVATYTYTAKKRAGRPFTGEVAGDSKAAVVAELRRKGLTVLRLEEKRSLPDFKTMLENSTSDQGARQGGLRAAVRHHDQLRPRGAAGPVRA